MTEKQSETSEDDGPDGMLAYALAIRNPSRNDPNWPLPSFDARDWAAEFVKIAKERPDMATDEGAMIGWFDNALMRGYDEHAMRVDSRREDRLVMNDPKSDQTDEPNRFHWLATFSSSSCIGVQEMTLNHEGSSMRAAVMEWGCSNAG